MTRPELTAMEFADAVDALLSGQPAPLDLQPPDQADLAVARLLVEARLASEVGHAGPMPRTVTGDQPSAIAAALFEPDRRPGRHPASHGASRSTAAHKRNLGAEPIGAGPIGAGRNQSRREAFVLASLATAAAVWVLAGGVGTGPQPRLQGPARPAATSNGSAESVPGPSVGASLEPVADTRPPGGDTSPRSHTPGPSEPATSSAAQNSATGPPATVLSATSMPQAYPEPASPTPGSPATEAGAEPSSPPAATSDAGAASPSPSHGDAGTDPSPVATRIIEPVTTASPTLEWRTAPPPRPTVTVPPTPSGGIPTAVATDTPAPVPTRTPRIEPPTESAPARRMPRDRHESRLEQRAGGAKTIGADTDASVWHPEWGGFSDMADLHIVNSVDMWAVGSGMARYDGRTWRSTTSPPSAYYTAVDFGDDGAGWIVGRDSDGVALPVQAGALGEPRTLPGLMPRDVAVLSMSEAWLVAGRSGRDVVLRLENGEWVEHWQAPELVELYAVWFATPTSGWLAGSEGFVARYDGHAWEEFYSPTSADLHALAGDAAGAVWAVGGTPWSPFVGDELRVRLRFDGLRWSLLDDEDDAPGFVDVTAGSGFAYALAADGTVHELGDTERRQVAKIYTAGLEPPSALALTPDDEGFIVVAGASVYRVTGGTVSIAHDGLLGISSLAVVSDEAGWALGPRQSLELGPDGWQLLADASPLADAQLVSAAPDGSAWAAGAGRVFRRPQSGSWEEVAVEAGGQLTTLRAVSGSEAWLAGLWPSQGDAGAASRVYVYSSGQWQMVLEVPGTGIAALAAVDSSQVWMAAGANGIWHFDGVEWRRELDAPVFSIDMVTLGSGLAAGSRVYRYDGATWSETPGSTGEGTLSSLAAAPDGTAWVLRSSGALAYFDGTAWLMVASPLGPRDDGLRTSWLTRVAVASDPTSGGDRVWLAGHHASALLRGERQAVIAAAPDPGATPPWRPSPAPTPTATPRPAGHTAYVPVALNRPARRSALCPPGIGGSEQTATEAAAAAARHASTLDSLPTLVQLELVTVAEIDAKHGTELSGTRIGERELHGDVCIWWASFAGSFDCNCGDAHLWTTYHVALFADDATAFFELFLNPAE
jgi:hypothetical protein